MIRIEYKCIWIGLHGDNKVIYDFLGQKDFNRYTIDAFLIGGGLRVVMVKPLIYLN